MNIHTYSYRALNPFTGTIQVIESEYARALSSNGVLWSIQVLERKPSHSWRSHTNLFQEKEFFNWANWSPKKGILNIFANPIFDMGSMERAGKDFIEVIENEVKKVPYKLKDTFELWACDNAEKPIALLASAYTESGIENIDILEWKAYANIREKFLSEGHGQSRASLQQIKDSKIKYRYLETQVKKRSKRQVWIHRLDNKEGYSLKNRKEYHERDFPIFGVTDKWDNSLIEEAFSDYFMWCAPLLLLLDMPNKKRGIMEKFAAKQPLLLEQYYHLYPKINDVKLIDQIRVQARILRSK
tara:strand:- start:423 stop:1319 length:897 start_codon:yes stop_codon:yes gene_type:complete